MNILITAYAISPNHGSEPGMGWNWITQIAKYFKVFVITEIEFKTEIEIALQKLPQKDNLFFYYNDIGEKAREMCWNQGDYRFYYFYKKWQKKTYLIAQSIIQDNKIDLIHQLNMIGYREPGYLYKIEDIPLVWGPVGGLNFVPFTFFKEFNYKEKLFYSTKNSLNYIQIQTNVRVRKMLNRSNLILSASGNSKEKLKYFFKKDSIIINETGLTVSKNNIQNKNLIKNEFNVVWVGRFISTKMLGLALKIIQKLSDLNDLKFHIIGDSPNNDGIEKWKKISDEMGISDICHFHGQISKEEVQKYLQNSDLLLFTSIIEGTSHVILESIANNLPILCFNTCGHGEIVDESIGIKIDVSKPNKSITLFSEKIRYLYQNRDDLKSMSDNCNRKKETLSWEYKGKQLLELYNKLLV